MCNFFSLVSDDKYIYYSDWEVRQQHLSGELEGSPDSHTSIAHYAGFDGAAEDNLNKYEYNPLTRELRVDRMGREDDRETVLETLKSLDWKKIAPAFREEIAGLHRTEPYVYAQMIAGRDAPRYGEAKNSWLTGTAAWNWVAMTQHIIGVRPELGGLRVEPS